MARYARQCGCFWRIERIDCAALSYAPAKRVPAAVRAALVDIPVGGVAEVEYDAKQRRARIVDYWERYHG